MGNAYKAPYQVDSKGVELAIQQLAFAQAQATGAGYLNEIGMIVPFGGVQPPTGWLLCDGSAVSRSTFSALFAILGTAFGAGDGSTTFNLPNLKGRVPVGQDTTQTEFDVLGETGGAKTHTLTIAEMPAHAHEGNRTTGSGASNYGIPPSNNTFSTNSGTAATINTGGGGAHNNLQPYQVVNYIIRYAMPLNNPGQIAVPQIPYRASAYLSANQNINDATTTLIAFNTIEFDPLDSFNETASNYKYVVPVSGNYLVTADIQIQDAGGKFVSNNLYVYKNGVNIKTINNSPYPGIATATTFATSYSKILQLTAGDYIQFYALIDTSDATTGEIVGGATGSQCSFHLLST